MPTPPIGLGFGKLLDQSRPTDLIFGEPLDIGADQSGALLVRLRRPGVAVVLSHDNAVQRGVAGYSGGRWRDGRRAQASAQAPWGQTGRADAAAALPWGAGVRAAAEWRAPHGAQIKLSAATALPWVQALPVESGMGGGWVPRRIVSRWLRLQHQDGRQLGDVVASTWRDRSRSNRPLVISPWRDGQPAVRELRIPTGSAAQRWRTWALPWQQARRTPAGVSPGIVVPPVVPGCYTPPRGNAVALPLSTAWLPSTLLRFSCRLFDLPPTWAVPYLRVYMSTHSISATRLPDAQPVTLTQASISTDADAFCWSLNASGPAQLLEQLAPTAGAPAQVSIVIDGMEWVFVVEGLSRSRQFGQWRTQIRGRSVTALLAEPYAASRTWLSGDDVLAQQIVNSALDLSGISATWALDDWLIPAGAWSHQGAPLSAVMRVAEAAGAVVQSHRSLPQLDIAPRYPLMPWEWSGSAVAPDVQLPLASVVTDSFERRDGPAYNRVIVSGQAQGVTGIVTRTGTAGDLAAASVTDALITAAAAARQRGRAVLGAGGAQASVSLTLPVLTGGTLPGVLSVGQLLEVVEPAETWRGLVRGVSLQAGMPTVRQTVAVERHLA